MSKRKRLKEFWVEKVVPNKGKIASRAIKMGAFYVLTGPTAALAINATGLDVLRELNEAYAGVAQSCLGGKKFLGFIPTSMSYTEGALCTALVLTCGVAFAQGLGNGLTDAACVALLRNIAAQKSA